MLLGPLALALAITGTLMLNFVFFYPLLMSALWIAGGLFFWLNWERKWP